MWMFQVGFVLAALFLNGSMGCMCMPHHPQEQLCRGDSFVAIVRIRSEAFVTIPEQSKESMKKGDLFLTYEDRLRHEQKMLDKKLIDKRLPVPTASPDERIVDVESDKESMSQFIRYRIKVYKAYKGFTTKGAGKRKLYIYTAPSDGLCGRKLRVKKTYMITGSVVDGRLTVGLCDQVISWNNFPKGEKRNVRKNMKVANKVCQAGCEVRYCPWSNCKPKDKNVCAWNSDIESKYGSRLHPSNFLCYRNVKGRCTWNTAKLQMATKNRKRRYDTKKMTSGRVTP